MRGIVQAFATRRGGNVAITTALVLPLMVIAAFGGVSVTQALTKRQELRDLADLACARAVKPTRMTILKDDDRTALARTFFAHAAKARGLDVTGFAVTSGWLSATVTASARVPTLETFAIKTAALDVSVSATCQGLPPYPAVGDTILSSHFTRPDGTRLPMKYGTWGVYKASEFGWDGGSGRGVEIQNWVDPLTYGDLHSGFASTFVVELDSFDNSTMERIVELHKGTYRFSFWYFARKNPDLVPGSPEAAETNRISVYLQRVRSDGKMVRDDGPKVRKLTVAKAWTDQWTYEQFTIKVDAYSLYRLTVAAEGPSDTYGGNFNDLKLDYIGRPGDHVG